MNKGVRMFSYGVLYLGLTSVAFALAYLYSENEAGRLAQMESKISEVRTELVGLKRLQSQQDMLALTTTEMAKKANDVAVEMEKLQEHCAMLRKDQMHLQNEVSKKKPLLGFSGPLQVEIIGGKAPFTPPKNLGKKTRVK